MAAHYTRLAIAALLAMGVAAMRPHPTLAAGVTDCPTTEAMLTADITQAGSNGTVALNCAGATTIAFGSLIDITASVTLDASGSPGTMTFDGGSSVPLFRVLPGSGFTVNSLTFAHGKGGPGGAIFNYGTVSITNSILSGNSGNSPGAAIYNEGAVSITNSTFSGNSAGSSGAGGAIDNVGTVSIINSTLSGNSAGAGGAIFNQGGTMNVTNSTLSGNSAGPTGSGAAGGAILNGGTMNITNSTLSGNSAGYSGGAIYNEGAVSITNSTLSGNSATYGGTIFNHATMSIGGSIVAGSSGGNCYGSIITDNGYNLEDTASSTCGFSAANHDLIGQDPQLDPNGLRNNGGPTQTIALLSTSPVIDQIPASTGLCRATDQRGYASPDDTETQCDIGAYESGSRPPTQPTSPTSVSGSGIYGGPATLTATLGSGTTLLSGRTITFTLNAMAVGSAITDGSGVATLQNVSLAGINAGSYATAVGAGFAGDSAYSSSSGTGSLQVSVANQTIAVSTQAPAGAAYNSTFTVAATASSGLGLSYGGSGSCSNSGATFTMTGATGPCTVTYDQAGNSNYSAAPEVTETVNAQKADQTISFGTPPNPTYGDPPFTISAPASSGLAVSFSVGSTDQCTISGSTVTITGAGSCTVTASQSGNDNYNPAPSVSLTFSIAKQAATITLDASSLSQTYTGSARAVTATTSPGGLSYLVTYTGTAGTTYDSSPTAPTNAGSYSVSAAITDAAYTGSTSDILTVAKADQTINFPAIANKLDSDADFDPGASASSGLAVTYTASGACSIAGGQVHLTGAGSCVVVAAQDGDTNYNPASSVSRTVSILAPLTISAGSPTMTYGDTTVPSITPTYAGFVNGDTPGALTTQPDCGAVDSNNHPITISSTTPVGSYTTICASAFSPSYVISYQPGTFTVNKAALAITAPSPKMTYGDLTLPDLTAVTDQGFVNNEGPSVLGGTLSCGLLDSHGTPAPLNSSLPAGSYTTSCAGQTAQNYTVTYKTGLLPVAQAALSITANSLTVTYDGSVPAITPIYTGLVNGQAAPATAPTCTSTAPATGAAGTYSTSCAGAADPNYGISYVAGMLTINQASQAISFSALPAHTVGDLPFTATATGGASGNPVTFTTSPSTVCTASGLNGTTITIVGAGICAVDANQAGNGNYGAAPQVEQRFTVNPALLLTLTTTPPSGSTITRGGMVRVEDALTNNTRTTQQVTLALTFTYVYGRFHLTFYNTSAAFTLNPGQTAGRSFSFRVPQGAPRGTYTVTLTAKDTAGHTTSASTSLTVS